MNSKPDQPASANPETPDISPPPTPTCGPFGVPRKDLLTLVGLSVAFTIALTYFGQLRFEDFFATNWDLGINQQMLWSTAHGRLLYESGDAEFFGLDSILLIHSTYIAFVFVPLYAAAPVPATLFALQGAAFAASIFPLYLLARRIIQSRTLTFVTIGLYLVGFGALSSLFYDFHWEAFLPVEFLSFFYLIQVRRYKWSLVPVAIGILTLEVFPALVAGAVLLKVYERLRERHARGWSLLKDREIRLQFGFLVGMAGAYLVLRLTQYLVLPVFVAAPGRSAGVATGITNPVFQTGFTASTLGASGLYWILLLAAFAFIPLLVPRYLILTLPWFVGSVFLTPLYSSYFGSQYAVIAGATLSVGLVYGVGRLERTSLRSGPGAALVWILGLSGVVACALAAESSAVLLSGHPPTVLLILMVLPVLGIVSFEIFCHLNRNRVANQEGDSVVGGRKRRRQARIAVLGLVLTLFVGFNLVMSPLNSANFGATPMPGYSFSYEPNPLSGEIGWLTTRIPPNAVVLASDDLFPYVANNLNAWAVPWFPVIPGQPPLHFPFSSTNLPRYVLVDSLSWVDLPTSISSQLWNDSTYGLVGYILSQTGPGSVYLFEIGYTQAAAMRSIGEIPQSYLYPGKNLVIGPSGTLVQNSRARFGTTIQSQNVSNDIVSSTNMWYGPYQTFPQGNYTLVVNLSGGLNAGVNSGLPILYLNGGPNYLPALYNRFLTACDFNMSGWTDIVINFALSSPFPLVEFRGYLVYNNGKADGHVSLNFMELTRNS